MSRTDEDIIRMINEEESKNKLKSGKIASLERTLMDGVLDKEVIIEGEKIKFKETLVIEEKVAVLIPETFTLLEEEFIKMKYPASKGFDSVYTDDAVTVNCTFSWNQTEISDDNIEDLKDDLLKFFRELYPKADFYENGVETFTNKKIGFFDLLFDAPDGKMYNLIIVMELEGKLYMSNFNCTEDKVKYWRPILKGIMKSIKVVKDGQNEVIG